MSFPAYWPGVCQDCGQRYPEGTPITMLPGVGWGHAGACPDDAEQAPTKPDYRGVWLGAYDSGTVKHFYLSAPTAHFGKISACGMGAANTVDVPRGDVRKCVGCLKVLTGKRPIAKAAYV